MAYGVGMDDEYTLPEGQEWATGSLLDPANVGKYVWPVWNSNYKRGERPHVIVKITRTNVHAQSSSSTPWSMRVDDLDAGYAYGAKGGFSVAVETQEYRQHRQHRAETGELTGKLRNIQWSRLPIDVLRQVVALVAPDA